MTKIDITFNDKNYSIDESSLSDATAALQSHLSNNMSGSGAVINLGGVSYNVDSTKLSNATSDFVSYLSTIAGSGHKVVIGGVEYGVDSDKVSGAISEVATVLDNLSKPVVKDIVLEVKKITANVGENDKYQNQEFILIDVHVKANETVSVTYGGLTKTLTNNFTDRFMPVYFGTYCGETDSVETPSSGLLTIEGYCEGFRTGQYNNGFKNRVVNYYNGITNVISWGAVSYIPNYMFNGCADLSITSLPENVTSIGDSAFDNCTNLALTSLPENVTSIGYRAFIGCSNLALTSLPENLTRIGMRAFYGCVGLTSITFKNPLGWWVSNNSTATSGTAIDVSDPENNVTLLTTTYKDSLWGRS